MFFGSLSNKVSQTRIKELCDLYHFKDHRTSVLVVEMLDKIDACDVAYLVERV